MTTARFAGRRALVTGGAGGIGSAIARQLRREGAEVVILDLADGLDRRAEEIGVLACAVDLTDPTAIESAVAGAASLLGGPCDLLVNAAGVCRIVSLEEMGPAQWEQVLAVNLAAPMYVARAFRAALGAEPGAIVNVSSIAAYRAVKAEPAAHYQASKGGLESLTRQMAVEWAPSLRVNAVSPGVIDTSMLRVMDDPEAGRAYLEQHVPLQRLGRPEEVAELIAFLLADESSYITGVAVPIDGGIVSC